jgi:hypothetical protein
MNLSIYTLEFEGVAALSHLDEMPGVSDILSGEGP